MKVRVAFGHCDFRRLHYPSIVTNTWVLPSRDKYVVKSLAPGVRCLRVNGTSITRTQFVALILIPAPRVVDVITRRAILFQVELRRWCASLTRSLRRVITRSKRTVRMEDPPHIPHGSIRRDKAMCQGKGQHVEVSRCDHQTTLFTCPFYQLGHLPCLSRAVTDI